MYLAVCINKVSVCTCARTCVYMCASHIDLFIYICCMVTNLMSSTARAACSADIAVTITFSQGPRTQALLESTQGSLAMKSPNDPNPWEVEKKISFFLHSEVKPIIGCRIFLWDWNSKINLWPRASLCSLERISWLQLEALAPHLFSWSCSLLWFSFVVLPDMPKHLSS